ncbi:MAG: DUF5916 domain-containing protein [Thermoanaerobaculia bacterium]
MRHAVSFLLLILLATPAGAQEAPVAATYEVRPASSPIEIDGVLDEPAWSDALVIPLEYEWFPGDNTPPPVRTDAMITFDTEEIYVAFRAFDPDPSAIRAHLMDRDEIFTFVQDDHVTLMLDPFNDERRALQFRVNPLGVQADAIFSQIEGVEDFSWDIIWDSAGRITDEGYVVEIAIPVNQIRFPETDGPQTWGAELGRSYPRSVRHRITASPRDRDDNCLLCQVNKVTGFRGLEPGRNVEVVPTVTAVQTDTAEDFPIGGLQSGDAEVETGVTARWGITPALTMNGAINPDFSQIEADAAQLEVNERFALFFEEKRPFFLEGVDLFSTPINAVFTRTVVDPAWGVKLTGKEGGNSGGIFVTQDEVNSLVIPSNQGSRFAFLEDDVTSGVARYRRDVGAESTVGLLVTTREGDGYHNRVAGLDAFLRVRPTDEVRLQYLRSDTDYPDALALEHGEPLESFDGDGFTADYFHIDRDWIWSASYTDLDPQFRADSGFVPRVDVRTARAQVVRRFWGGEGDWYSNWSTGITGIRTTDHSGQLTDQTIATFAQVSGPLQSVVNVSLTTNDTFFGGLLHEDLVQGSAFGEMQPGAIGKLSLFVQAGDTVDFVNNQPADVLLLNPAVELKLGRHLNAQISHIFHELEVDAGRLSETNITDARIVYTFSTRMFVRAIVQMQDIRRAPERFGFPVEPEVERLFSQFLFSYKLNPQTVLFLGYSDNQLGLEAIDLTPTDRTFFAKIGYAWIF